MDNVSAVIGVIPMRYDPVSDELVPVTQEWVDKTQQSIQDLGFALGKLREIVKLPPKDIRNVKI